MLQESQRRMQAARSILEEAAALAMTMRPAPGSAVGKLKGLQDWVTQADNAVEELIADRLTTLFPNDSFQGEETGLSCKAGQFRWVVDPIDGTANYARGRNRWCVSIGLMYNTSPIVGLICAPALDETYIAMRGQGAFLNGRPIRTSDVTDTTVAMIEMGWSHHVPTSIYLNKLQKIRELGCIPRTGGSGALALAETACGRQDGYIEMVINLWDVAAALVLLMESGARVTPFLRDGGLERPSSIMAVTPGIADILAKALDIPLL